MYEVEDGSGDVIPFFEVALGNDRYDSRTMGTGELAIFFLWWSIERASEDAMILIEEPECYLSPGSQEALCNYLVKVSVEKHLTIVMTSHSAKIISCLSDENLIFVYRHAEGIRVVDGPPPPALLETIGIVPPIDAILFVEDEAARQFCHLLLERFRPSLSRRVEITSRDGDGNIVTALRIVGRQFRAIAVVGLFDGDMRGKVPVDVEELSAFLPGNRPIEVCFRELVESNPAALMRAIGSDDLGPILFGLQGVDHHDWYAGLCRQVGYTKDQLFPILFQIWAQEADNASEGATVIDELAKRLTPSR